MRSTTVPATCRWTTTTTTSAYGDDFGNATSAVTVVAGGGHSFTTTTVSDYDNDAAKWHLGRVTRSTTTKRNTGGWTVTRASAFAYDGTTGLLKQEVVEPGNAALRLTTDYEYDVFGNITRTTVSGADITSRSTTTTYSADGRFPEVTTNAPRPQRDLGLRSALRNAAQPDRGRTTSPRAGGTTASDARSARTAPTVRRLSGNTASRRREPPGTSTTFSRNRSWPRPARPSVPST